MSRSNPNEQSRNPSSRWIDWSGSRGELSYYDKDEKAQKVIGDKFTFLLLDNLSCIKGWHDPSESGIYSNEVRDTRSEQLVVKAFKGGTLAEGLYADIKDRVNNSGGKFTSNLYIAYRDGAELKIGAISLSGAALSSWMEFSKNNRSSLNSHAVKIDGSVDGKKGSVKFKTPKFSLVTVSQEANDQAVELDRELQAYLTSYLAKNKAEQGEAPRGGDYAQYESNRSEADAFERSENESRPTANPADWDTDDIPF